MPHYHITLNSLNINTMVPRIPLNVIGKKSKFTEPDIPRVCFGPTVKQCFGAIFSNVSKYFEEDNKPYIDFYVYKTLLDNPLGLVSNDEVVLKRAVHDAHVTGECWVTEPVEICLESKIRVFNTNDSKMIQYHPFNDNNEPIRGAYPEHVKITVLQEYPQRPPSVKWLK